MLEFLQLNDFVVVAAAAAAAVDLVWILLLIQLHSDWFH